MHLFSTSCFTDTKDYVKVAFTVWKRLNYTSYFSTVRVTRQSAAHSAKVTNFVRLEACYGLPMLCHSSYSTTLLNLALYSIEHLLSNLGDLEDAEQAMDLGEHLGQLVATLVGDLLE